ncbi:MAG TPA: hypothetical protein GX506_11935, partial [Firmicutes bacterium]|nr:hypothetical protein [Bacillota bacterium]
METIRGILKGLVDLIFPAMPCPLCGAGFNPTGLTPEGMVVCKSCRERIPFITPPICSRCGKPLRGAEMGSRLCLDCATFGRAFEVARAVGVYDGLLREYIHHMKYRGNRVVGEVLGMLMAGPV